MREDLQSPHRSFLALLPKARCPPKPTCSACRGLVELIVLNIGYNVGVFSPTLFTMLVVMALITTMCTTPSLNLLGIQNDSSRNRLTGGKRTSPPAFTS
jgi:hypothetical protein